MTAEPPQSPFRFHDLPPELRNRTYTFLLSQAHPILLVRPPYSLSRNIDTAILRTSHQVHDEAVSILYGNNTLDAWRDELSPFLKSIGSSIQHIRQFKIHCSSAKTHPRKGLTLLKGARMLQVLELGGNVVSRFTVEEMAQMLGPSTRALHKARGKMAGYDLKVVLDVISSKMVGSGLLTEVEWERVKRPVEEYERRVKEIVGATLRP